VPNSKDTLALHAHTMRQAPTESEARLWRALRSSQLGVAFRRQVPLLGFIADFYAPSARIIVEVDGGYHARRATADARRDRKLARAGYRIVRLEVELVMRDLSVALLAVRRALDEP
jgi:very-short-patch-repair endonuclease